MKKHVLLLITLVSLSWGDYIKLQREDITVYDKKEDGEGWFLYMGGKLYNEWETYALSDLKAPEKACKSFMRKLGYAKAPDMTSCNDIDVLNYLDNKFGYKLITLSEWHSHDETGSSSSYTYYLRK